MQEFTDEKFGDVTLIKLNISDATLQSAAKFKNYLSRLIKRNDIKLLVDCREINYMDSTFLGALVFGLKQVVANGGDLRLILRDVQSPVWTMFQTTKMYRVFKTYTDEDEALSDYTV